MGEGWLTHALTNGWALAAFAYLTGLFTGWVVWSRARHDSKERDSAAASALENIVTARKRAKAEPSPTDNNDAPEDVKLAALEAEIKQARSLLEAEASEQAALDERLSGVDDAVKRANGRLKLVLKSINNGKNGD